ncbi:MULTISPECIES: rod shape-determining protein MreC [Aminobacterium]|jgi:rod shape-determining protein MreC|uniref:rod shape-determining protein MreC n=1 Tax=Aminobacterium TaxID=81466 RepID=UPI00257D0BB4|nr:MULTISPECIES: rod shape-determining protein MreC [unclassified Aminobacterium]
MRRPLKGNNFSGELIHGLIAIAISLLLLAFAPRAGEVYRIPADAVGKFLYYPEYPAVFLNATFRKLSLWFTERASLISQIQSLSRENWLLKVAAGQRKVAEEIIVLDSSIVNTRVTLRSPENWWTEIRLNKGQENGLKPGLPMLQDGYLIGRLSRVESGYSWGDLITSPSLLIPVVVDQTRDLGVVTGDGQGSVWLQYVPEGRFIEKGMTVSTALVSESLPPGLPIGMVTGETRRLSGDVDAYKIQPGGDFVRLYTVEILTEEKKKP